VKTNLFYFSATGNSLVVARDIAAGLQEAQVFSIPQVIDGEINLEADNIGIVFPEYYSGIPRIISEFIRKLDPARIKYLFVVCTYGGFILNTLHEVREQLQAAGIPLNAGFSVQMPGNYIVNYSAFKKERQEKLLGNEKEAVRQIIQDIENQKNNSLKQSFTNKIWKLIYKLTLPKFRTYDKNFTADQKCNGCEICEKVCPVRNIKMTEHRPQWQGNCEHCLACIQWCPREAIQYASKTSERERYHHPEVKAKDLYRS
jgi:formate hydrogenlyase subunit 6/NADH:ubiquinone oxidoreductase subunit I/flavodoxin